MVVRVSYYAILTIKWFATANLLNVSIYAEKWLVPVLTSYASSVADVANHFVLRINAKLYRYK